MGPEILLHVVTTLIGALSAPGAKSFKGLVEKRAKDRFVTEAARNDLDELSTDEFVELLANMDGEAFGETREEAEEVVGFALNTQVSISEQQLHRHVRNAEREHLLAQVSIGLIVVTLIVGIVLLFTGVIVGGSLSLVGTILSGVSTKVFLVREKRAEDLIETIRSDLRESEKARERFELLKDITDVIPAPLQETVMDRVLGKPAAKRIKKPS